MSAQVVPSRMNLALYKTKIASAKKGHELLKRKCDALKTKFRTIMVALLDTKGKMGEQVQDALLLFASAQYVAGELATKVKDSVKRSTFRVDFAGENIAGVILPIYTLKEFEDADSNLNQIGIDRGGQQVQKCRDKFKEVLFLLVSIASLQTSFINLDEVIKITNRRVNALEYIVIPRFISTYRYIDQELEEIGNEELFRLKKVLEKKKKILAEEESDKKKRFLAAQQLASQSKGGKANAALEEEGGGNLLDEENDEDLLFK